MENYSLQTNEVLLYEANAYYGIRVLLTNINLVLVKTTQKMFKKEQVEIFVYPNENIKIYNDIPQVKQKDMKVAIFLTTEEVEINFPTRLEAHKFVNAVNELLTGKSMTTRGAEKVRGAIDLVDNALGINTVDTVKNVIENGVAGGLLGGIGKKVVGKGKASLLSGVANVAKGLVSGSEEPETKADPFEEIKKFAELKEMGIISEEEFAEKKKELLGM